MRTLAIIGGSQKRTFENMARKRGLKLLFHDGRTGGGNVKKQFQSIVRKSDAIVIMEGAINHHSMWKVKELAEELNKPIGFVRGFGASSALNLAEEMLAG